MYATIDAAAALQKLTEKLPGMAEVMKPDHPGMNTVDRRVVARSGRVFSSLSRMRVSTSFAPARRSPIT